MVHPGKFVKCKHLAVFDLHQFLTLFCQANVKSKIKKSPKTLKSKCPICAHEWPITDLKKSDYFAEVLAGTDSEEIHIHSDGNWKAVVREDLQPVDVSQIVKSEPGVQIATSRCKRSAPPVSQIRNEELIRSKDAEIAALLARNRKLEQENSQKNAEIAERDEKLRVLGAEKKDLREKVRKLSDMDTAKSAQNLLGARMQNRSLESELRNLKDEMRQDRTETDSLRKDKEKLEAELATERGKGNAGKEEVTKLRQQVDQLLLEKERSADAIKLYNAVQETGLLKKDKSSSRDRSPKRKKSKRSKSKEKENKGARKHSATNGKEEYVPPPPSGANQSNDSVIVLDD